MSARIGQCYLCVVVLLFCAVLILLLMGAAAGAAIAAGNRRVFLYHVFSRRIARQPYCVYCLVIILRALTLPHFSLSFYLHSIFNCLLFRSSVYRHGVCLSLCLSVFYARVSSYLGLSIGITYDNDFVNNTQQDNNLSTRAWFACVC